MIYEGIRLYSEIDRFITDMNFLLTHLEPHNRLDRKFVWKSFKGVLEIYYKHYKDKFQKRGEALDDKAISREQQREHSYSVAQLRREYRKVHRKAREKFG